MEKVILNPAYLLRQDGNRVIICSQQEEKWGVDEWFSFIHPYQAKMLSFFKGKFLFEKELRECADYFGLPLEKMGEIITPYINNKEWFNIRSRNHGKVSFPKRLLISFTDDAPLERSCYYQTDDFLYKGEPDYGSLRLSYPINVNFELLMNCYVDCSYCYANRKLKDKARLETEEVIKFIRQCRKEGVLFFDINGGDVLLHPDIDVILEELILNGYDPLVSTKFPAGKELLKKLKTIGLKKFQVSLDSASQKTLKRLIKAPDGYINRMAQTLRDASDLKFPVDINVVLTKLNVSELEIEGLMAFLAEYGAVKNVRFNPCGYSLYKQNFEDIALSIDAIKRAEEFISRMQDKYTNLSLKFSGYDSEKDYCDGKSWETFARRALCTGNTRNVVMLPNGDVTICEELYDNPRFIIGNIRQNSLQEIWESSKAISLFRLHENKFSASVCCRCEEAVACRNGAGVCWKTVLMAYGEENWDYPDPRCPKAPVPFRAFYSK